MSPSIRRISIAAALALLSATSAPAQMFNRPAAPPADLGDEDQPPPGAMQQRGPDLGAFTVRIERMERQLRDMTGQIEQLQFENRKLEEQVRKLSDRPAAAPTGPVVVPATPAAPAEAGRLRRSDAFDPAVTPNAPGAPRPLGQTPASNAPATPGAGLSSPNRPLDLNSAKAEETPAVAPVQPMGARQEFEQAASFLKQGQYEQAEKGFSGFLAKHPRSKLAADATYDLGESFYLRNRHREAAEQYLKITTAYSNSARGPEALVRLGQSLVALGAKEQACASFAEVSTKYPSASSAIRAAERESKKTQC
ncbi:MAG: tol-pal system protein YbgF [Hyphomicrobiales bacterium]|nr:tol-pal system protein YbgF [Hyphomicrobiales bacterium]